MKKAVALLIVSFLILGLAGCQSQSVPSDALLEEDVIKALAAHNPYASLISMETVKSMTNEDSYEVTMRILAETKYADWEYEVDMTYLNYDQGWMMDDVNFTSEEYSIKNNFDVSDLSWYCSDYLSENWIFNLDTSNNGIEYDAETKLIVFTWYIDYEKKHSIERTNYWIYWKYDTTTDNWIPSSELFSHTDDPIPNYNLDFSGEWDLRNRVTGEVISLTPIIIENFSWAGFNARVPGFFDSNVYFQYTEDEPYYFKENPGNKSRFSDITFTDGGGKFITFKFNDNVTYIYYYDDHNDMMLNGYRSAVGCVAYVEVTVDLPELP